MKSSYILAPAFYFINLFISIIICLIVSFKIFSSSFVKFWSTNLSIVFGLSVLGQMPTLIRLKSFVFSSFIIDWTPLWPAEPLPLAIFNSPIGKSMSS